MGTGVALHVVLPADSLVLLHEWRSVRWRQEAGFAMPVQNFRDLDAWNVGMELVLRIYRIAGALPVNERFEMASQLRRAAVSVPSNVAEGHASGLRRRYRNHVRIALGSVAELVTCVELATQLGYIAPDIRKEAVHELDRMSRLLHGILRNIRRQLAARAAATGILLCAVLYGLR